MKNELYLVNYSGIYTTQPEDEGDVVLGKDKRCIRGKFFVVADSVKSMIEKVEDKFSKAKKGFSDHQIVSFEMLTEDINGREHIDVIL